MATGTWRAGHTWRPGAEDAPAPKRRPVIADLTPLTRLQVARLKHYLAVMIHHVEELGCTCERRNGPKAQGYHRPRCTGNNLTADARRYLTRLRRKGLVR